VLDQRLLDQTFQTKNNNRMRGSLLYTNNNEYKYKIKKIKIKKRNFVMVKSYPKNPKKAIFTVAAKTIFRVFRVVRAKNPNFGKPGYEDY